MLKLTCLVLAAACVSVSSSFAHDPLAMDKFEFQEPRPTDLGGSYKLWATYYYLPEIAEDSGSYPLRDMQGQELGPRLTLRHWCDTAMEGSVKINYKSGDVKTFNYAGTSTEHTVNCKSIYPKHSAISKTKFREANGMYGDGLDEYILSPYRTLATDGGYITPGTVLYIPKARGAKITLASGRVIIHDGYFFAGDKGGAIKGSHVDVYIGNSTSASFFPWIGSSQSKTFEAYVVKDPQIIADLLSLHTMP